MAFYEDECGWCGTTIRGGWPETEETEQLWRDGKMVTVGTGRLKEEHRAYRPDMPCTRPTCLSHIKERLREDEP